MKVLIVASYNKNRFVPFVQEQGDALQAAGCEIEWFGIKRKGIVGYLREIPRLRKMIREIQPDVVHAHYGLSCLVANLATRSVPVVSTYHGSDINESFARKLSKIAMRLSAWNIFVSQRIMDLAGAVEGIKASLVPCGVNLPMPWSELQKQKVEQLTLNQWVEGVLVESGKWKVEGGKKYVLFAGAFDNAVKDPELAKASVALLDDLQLVELKGYNRDQVNALMYSCDCLLMTSKTEGSPQVIKEAMACDCPIVSVDVGDVAERTNGVDGCYIVPSRKQQDIVASIKQALAFNGKTNGREKIIEYGLTNELVAKQIIEIYQEILRN